MKLIRDKPAELAAAAVAVVLCLLFGSGWLTTWLYARLGVLNVPTALGVPAGLPGLRLWPLGETAWWATITDTIAAVAFITLVFLWLHGTRARRPEAGPIRLLLSGWTAAILAAMAANVLRVVVGGFVAEPSLTVYLGVAGAAVGFGLLWGLALGWLPGLAAMVARRLRGVKTVAT